MVFPSFSLGASRGTLLARSTCMLSSRFIVLPPLSTKDLPSLSPRTYEARLSLPHFSRATHSLSLLLFGTCFHSIPYPHFSHFPTFEPTTSQPPYLEAENRAYYAFENTRNHGDIICWVLKKYLFYTLVTLVLLYVVEAWGGSILKST